MRNVLVTGGAGFIGSNFVRYLLKADAAVTHRQPGCADLRRQPGEPERHPGPTSGIPLSKGIFAMSAWSTSSSAPYQIDTVVHFAAESHVDRSILDPAPFIQTNVIGTFTLLEAARQLLAGEKASWRAEAVRFHHVSTDEVFGSLRPGEPAFLRDHPLRAELALCRLQSRQRPPGARLRPHLWAAVPPSPTAPTITVRTSSPKS